MPSQLPADGCPHRPQVAYHLHCLSPAEKGLAHTQERGGRRVHQPRVQRTPPARRESAVFSDGLHMHFPFVYLEHQTSFPLTVSVRLGYSGTSFFYLNIHSLKLEIQHCFY